MSSFVTYQLKHLLHLQKVSNFTFLLFKKRCTLINLRKINSKICIMILVSLCYEIWYGIWLWPYFIKCNTAVSLIRRYNSFLPLCRIPVNNICLCCKNVPYLRFCISPISKIEISLTNIIWSYVQFLLVHTIKAYQRNKRKPKIPKPQNMPYLTLHIAIACFILSKTLCTLRQHWLQLCADKS